MTSAISLLIIISPSLSTLGQLAYNVNPRKFCYFIHMSSNPPHRGPRGPLTIFGHSMEFATETEGRALIYDVSRFQRCNFYWILIISKF